MHSSLERTCPAINQVLGVLGRHAGEVLGGALRVRRSCWAGQGGPSPLSAFLKTHRDSTSSAPSVWEEGEALRLRCKEVGLATTPISHSCSLGTPTTNKDA